MGSIRFCEPASIVSQPGVLEKPHRTEASSRAAVPTHRPRTPDPRDSTPPRRPLYLNGTLWCGMRWHHDQSMRRMVIRRTVSRSGEECRYFFCTGTQMGTSDARYSKVHRVEQAVEDHYRTVRSTPDFLAAMRESLTDALSIQESSQRALKKQLDGQLTRLDAPESNLLVLLIDEEIPKEKIRAKLRAIGATRDRLTAQLEATEDCLTEAVGFINANLRLLEDR